MQAPFEIELKFRCVNHTQEQIMQQVSELGGDFTAPVVQSDEYFAHPSRDFAVSGEAFRVRQIGDQVIPTYKGPKLQTEAKIREELEAPMPAGSWPALRQIILNLGFRSVAIVRKARRSAKLEYDSRLFTIDVDQVDHVGEFVEIETIAEKASIEQAEQSLLRLAEELGLSDIERSSYLRLLLAQRG